MEESGNLAACEDRENIHATDPPSMLERNHVVWCSILRALHGRKTSALYIGLRV